MSNVSYKKMIDIDETENLDYVFGNDSGAVKQMAIKKIIELCKGKDGTSPTISVTKITGGHRISITDVDGVKNIDVIDGSDGNPGTDGADGKSAYQYAQDGGYTGTEEEFANKLATEWATKKDVSSINEAIEELKTNGTGTGLTDDLKSAFKIYFTNMQTLFSQMAFSTTDHIGNTLISNAKAVVTALESTNSDSGGDSGETEPDTEPDAVLYSVTNNLDNVTTNNSATYATQGTSYTATLTANSGYNLDSVSVVMNGEDVTSTSYSNGIVTIDSVTGDIVITASAIEQAKENTSVTANFDVANTLVSEGVASANNSWVATDYIEIPLGYDYVVWQTETAYSYRGSYYNSNKEFIRSVTNNASISSRKLVKDEIPEDAVYMRLSTNTTTIGSIEMSFGDNLVTSWGTSSNNLFNKDGTVTENYTGTIQQYISNGYTKIPDGALKILWGNKIGYSFKRMTVGVYDDDYNCLCCDIGDNNYQFLSETGNTLDLSTLTNPVYIKAGAWSNGVETNNNPKEQIMFAYV